MNNIYIYVDIDRRAKMHANRGKTQGALASDANAAVATVTITEIEARIATITATIVQTLLVLQQLELELPLHYPDDNRDPMPKQ